MRDFFLNNSRTVIILVVLLEAFLEYLLVRLYNKSDKTMVLCLCLIDLGLLLDAVLILAGVDATVSKIRFIAHGILLPLNLPVLGYAAKLDDKKMKIIWAITAVIMVLGAAQGIMGKLEPVEFAGLRRYTQSKDNAGWIRAVTGLLSFGVVIPQLIAGIYVWKKDRTPFLFLSAFSMYVFSVIGPATGNTDLLFVISMIGEVLMIVFYYLYAKGEVKG